MLRQRIYVWQVPVRLTHWINVASIVTLSVTGYYISDPFVSVSVHEPYGNTFMGLMRWTHFVCAYIFVASLLLRTYWAFAGNQWARWRGLFPFLSLNGLRNMRGALSYYLFIRRRPPDVTGHNALAGVTYMIIVCLYAIQVVSGFAIYSQLHPVGIWPLLTGWIVPLVGIQTLRLTHHVIMYLLIAFAIHHIYSAWLVDIVEGNGIMSSIFSGFKFMPPHKAPDWIERPAQTAASAVTEPETHNR
jgi:Ni/Fe-hydrogenase 1 B-type cytochrome subunit